MHCTLPLSKKRNTTILAGVEVLRIEGALGTTLRRSGHSSGHHLGKGQRMVLSGPTRIRLEGPFSDSTLRGNVELGDNNQVEVALVMYFSG